ncbi:EAL domain-containing protein [Vibrio panuliri]|nr:EAL domain-containing protein [Vibrio panuliri]KAB1457585.1 EAL domain-containing protein [Vibrio panuliri]
MSKCSTNRHPQRQYDINDILPVPYHDSSALNAAQPLSGLQLDILMNSHFKYLFSVLKDGLFYMTMNREVFFYNPSFYQNYGINTGKIDLARWLAKVHPCDRKNITERMAQHQFVEDELVSVQYRVMDNLGNYVWIEAKGITKHIDGRRFMIGYHRDISTTKQMESHLHKAAYQDNASGLSNAQKLAIDIEEISDNSKQNYSLIYVHLEDIRNYLSLYGTQTLKDLMAHLLEALQALPDHFIDIYRIRSDDFVILVEGSYSAQHLEVLGRRILQTYKESIVASGSLWGNDISVGIYPNFYPNQPSEEIIKVASRTCQFARLKQQSKLAIYHEKTQQKVNRHFYIERELSWAIKNDKLSVKFQPIVDAQALQITSFETLVRWKDEHLGQIFPDEFIPIAEKKGLIVDLGYFVFDQACRFVQRYEELHNRKIRININVSVLQLLNSQFPEQAISIADKYQIAPQQIILELTETVILDGNKSAVSQLYRLNELGFCLSLDDFGSGYSSLNSFFDLPLKQIKVDKAMAWRALENPATLEYLKFITQLCQSYHVDVVIEGVECANMQHRFTEIGVNYLQGYWFGKPLSIASACFTTQV